EFYLPERRPELRVRYLHGNVFRGMKAAKHVERHDALKATARLALGEYAVMLKEPRIFERTSSADPMTEADLSRALNAFRRNCHAGLQCSLGDDIPPEDQRHPCLTLRMSAPAAMSRGRSGRRVRWPPTSAQPMNLAEPYAPSGLVTPKAM